MRNLRMTVYAILLAAVITISDLLPGALLPAYAGYDVDGLISGIFSCEKSRAGVDTVQELLDGIYSENAGVTSDWFVYSLMRYKSGYDYSSYLKQLKSKAESSSATATSREKFALIFGAAGSNKSYITNTLESDMGQLGIMSWIFGLHLLNNGYTGGSYYADDVVDILLSKHISDGGWALSGDTSDVDVTAMTIQALAPYYSRADVKKAINSALSFLSENQTDDGGFMSYGKKNPESAAQVVVALASLGIDPETDTDFIKNGKSAVDSMLSFRCSDGGYSHEAGGDYNLTATSQVLYALVSIKLLGSGERLYVYNTSGAVKKPASTTSEASVSKAAVNTTVKSSTKRAAITTTTRKSKLTTPSKRETTVRTTTKRSSSAKASKTTATETTAELSATVTTQAKETAHVTKIASQNTAAGKAAASVTDAKASASDDISVTEADTEQIAEESKAEAETVSETEASQSEEDISEPESEKSNVKIYIISGIWALVLAGAAILALKKNKKAINYIIIVLVGGVITAAVAFSSIESPDTYYSETSASGGSTIAVTMSITCDTVAGEKSEEITPSSGVILPETGFTLDEGATAYDCLIAAAKKYKIQIDDSTASLSDHSAAYIAGINYLYEFDYGDLSGWMFSVNGEFGDLGCGEYTLSDGDVIEWQYTRNLGEDLK